MDEYGKKLVEQGAREEREAIIRRLEDLVKTQKMTGTYSAGCPSVETAIDIIRGRDEKPKKRVMTANEWEKRVKCKYGTHPPAAEYEDIIADFRTCKIERDALAGFEEDAITRAEQSEKSWLAQAERDVKEIMRLEMELADLKRELREEIAQRKMAEDEVDRLREELADYMLWRYGMRNAK